MPATTDDLTQEQLEQLAAEAAAVARGCVAGPAIRLAENMPPRFRARAIRWLAPDAAGADRRSLTFCSVIFVPVITKGRPDKVTGKKEEVEGDPKISEANAGIALAGILSLALDDGGAGWVLDDHCIWEALSEASLDSEAAALIEAIGDAAEERLEITSKSIKAIVATAKLHARHGVPEQARRLVAFEDGFAWEVAAARPVLRRAITAEDGVRLPVALPCPEYFPDEEARSRGYCRGLNHGAFRPKNLLAPWLGGDDADLLARWIGLTASGSNDSKSIMILEGPSDGGKGRLIVALTTLVWRKTGSIRTEHLGGRFELGRLAGFNLALDPDAQPGALKEKGAALLKTISGGDNQQLEAKGANGGSIKNFEMHCLLAANYPLEVVDRGDAWLNRLIRIQVPLPVKKLEMFHFVWMKQVRASFGAWLIWHARRASLEIAEHVHLVRTEDQREAVMELTGPSSDRFIRDFIAGCTISRDQADKRTSAEIKARFETWCKKSGVPTEMIKTMKPGVKAAMAKVGFRADHNKSGLLIEWNLF